MITVLNVGKFGQCNVQQDTVSRTSDLLLVPFRSTFNNEFDVGGRTKG